MRSKESTSYNIWRINPRINIKYIYKIMNYTPFQEAFSFSTPNPQQYQTNLSNPSLFSNACPFCKNTNTLSLMADGSFRKCMNRACRKNFQAQLHQPINYQKPLQSLKPRHPNEYLNRQCHLLNDHNPLAPPPAPTTAPITFSQPNYDPQIRYK